MNCLVQQGSFRPYYSRFLGDYEKYLLWLDEEVSSPAYYYLATTNVKIRDKSDWNALGREIYDSHKLNIHASEIYQLLQTLKLKEFLVQHEYSPSIWFPSHTLVTTKVKNSFGFFRSNFLDCQIDRYSGGIFIDTLLKSFLSSFIDYPYLLNYKSIDAISLEADLILKITPHLTIDLISSNKDLMNQIIRLIRQTNLTVTPSPHTQCLF